jgi:hypothetical protein
MFESVFTLTRPRKDHAWIKTHNKLNFIFTFSHIDARNCSDSAGFLL